MILRFLYDHGMLWKRKVGFTADASVFCFFLNQCPEDASVLEWNVQVLQILAIMDEMHT